MPKVTSELAISKILLGTDSVASTSASGSNLRCVKGSAAVSFNLQPSGLLFGSGFTPSCTFGCRHVPLPALSHLPGLGSGVGLLNQRLAPSICFLIFTNKATAAFGVACLGIRCEKLGLQGHRLLCGALMLRQKHRPTLGSRRCLGWISQMFCTNIRYPCDCLKLPHPEFPMLRKSR